MYPALSVTMYLLWLLRKCGTFAYEIKINHILFQNNSQPLTQKSQLVVSFYFELIILSPWRKTLQQIKKL